MSLTGGLDSRMIMAWHKAAPDSLACYSFRGTFRDCQDSILGRTIARQCAQPHQAITVGSDFLSRFSRYAERTVWLSDGGAEVSRTADLYVNEQAREIAPVRMTGNGGEVLRRVRAFKPVDPSPGLFRPELLSHVSDAKRSAAAWWSHPLTFAVFQQAPWFNYGLPALEQTQLSMRSPFPTTTSSARCSARRRSRTRATTSA
jgi:asparagine synthase (glutamine-hydrolysing)